MRSLVVVALALAGCAAPGSSTRIPQPVAIALAGGDASVLPDVAWSSPPVELDMHWYDRAWGIQVDRDGGGAHFVDLQSQADGANALEARRSDNQRATEIVGSIAGALERGIGIASQLYGAQLAAPPPPAEPPAASTPTAEDEPSADGSADALLELLSGIEERLATLERNGTPPPEPSADPDPEPEPEG